MDRKILVKHYAGSIAYGTNIATSDVDFRGIFLGSRNEVTTPFNNVTEWVDPSEEDTKLFELNFFTSLATSNNPNILETLYVDNQDIVIKTPEYQHLRNNRDIFLSKKIAITTSAYALQELIKMKSHNKYINQDEVLKPKQTEFLELIQNFTSEKIMKNELNFEERFPVGYKMAHYGSGIFGLIPSERAKPFNFEHNINRQKPERDEHPIMLLRFKDDAYEAAKVKYKSYMAWKENRKNTVRNLIEEKFGYDTKNAMHLVRLMRTGYECVSEGVYIVKRPDAKELLNIREGAWPYDKLKDYAIEMDEKIKNAMKTSPLADEVNIEKVQKLIIDIQDSAWGFKSLPELENKTKKIFKP
jgi:hypothetical protein